MSADHPAPDDLPPRKGGRPPKFTRELGDKLILLLEGGNYRHVACKICGITKRTLQRWVKCGEEFPDGDYGEFCRRVMMAEAKAHAKALETIMEAATEGKDVRAAMWYLERKHAELWGVVRGELAKLERQQRELLDELARLKATQR